MGFVGTFRKLRLTAVSGYFTQSWQEELGQPLNPIAQSLLLGPLHVHVSFMIANGGTHAEREKTHDRPTARLG